MPAVPFSAVGRGGLGPRGNLSGFAGSAYDPHRARGLDAFEMPRTPADDFGNEQELEESAGERPVVPGAGLSPGFLLRASTLCDRQWQLEPQKTTTPRSASLATPSRRRFARLTGTSPASTIPILILETKRPRRSSRPSPRPTKSSATRKSARFTISTASTQTTSRPEPIRAREERRGLTLMPALKRRPAEVAGSISRDSTFPILMSALRGAAGVRRAAPRRRRKAAGSGASATSSRRSFHGAAKMKGRPRSRAAGTSSTTCTLGSGTPFGGPRFASP